MTQVLGFIGTGAMGEPMCRNLAIKGDETVIAYDFKPSPLKRLAADGVEIASGAQEVAERADILFLSLPGGPEVDSLAEMALHPAAREGWTVVDMSTTPVGLTRKLAEGLAEKGTDLIDAPVARTQKAAIDGTLSIMVGGSEALFDRVRPYLDRMGTEVSHCGATGCGQITKIMNNMIVFQNGVALAEALTIARENGMDGDRLFEVLTKSSADSFVLRSHGMGSMLSGDFPEERFPARYALKDVTYALALAADAKVEAYGAKLARAMIEDAVDAGDGEKYWPVILDRVERT